LYFASLRHSSDVVRGGGVRAEGVSTFQGIDRYGSISPYAFCTEVYNSAGPESEDCDSNALTT
jgi:hypothetical protein